MFNIFAEQIVKERHKELLRQAEQNWLLQQASESRPPRVSFWTRLRHRFESQVVDIGCAPLIKYFFRLTFSSSKTASLKPCGEKI